MTPLDLPPLSAPVPGVGVLPALEHAVWMGCACVGLLLAIGIVRLARDAGFYGRLRTTVACVIVGVAVPLLLGNLRGWLPLLIGGW